MMILYVLKSQMSKAETAPDIDSQRRTTDVLNISFTNNILTNRIEKKEAKTDINTSNMNTIFVFIYFCA